MAVNPDFRDLFRALSAERAEFLVVGGYAVMFFAGPRYTKDLDVWVRPTAANAERVLRAPPPGADVGETFVTTSCTACR